MATRCRDCPLRQKECFIAMSPEEVAFMERFKAGELRIEPGTPILLEGSNSPQMFTALSGMGLRHKQVADGRRQVLNFVLPGDFLGLQAAVMGEMQHSVEATTAMTLCVFDRSEFWRFMRSNPSRAYDMTWIAAIEEHFLGETIATLGQRSAAERIAWAIVRLYQRGAALGLVVGGEMRFPYKQQDLADALGLSLVHTNKTLGKLRERQLVSWTDRGLRVNDIDELAQLAVMDSIDVRMRPLM